MPQPQPAAATTSAASSDEADVPDVADTAAAADGTTADGFAAGLLPMLDVCGQEQTWGLLGMDLCCGEVVIAEADGCRLHQAPGALAATQLK
jgi:hypothetical protein